MALSRTPFTHFLYASRQVHVDCLEVNSQLERVSQIGSLKGVVREREKALARENLQKHFHMLMLSGLKVFLCLSSSCKYLTFPFNPKSRRFRQMDENFFASHKSRRISSDEKALRNSITVAPEVHSTATMGMEILFRNALHVSDQHNRKMNHLGNSSECGFQLKLEQRRVLAISWGLA